MTVEWLKKGRADDEAAPELDELVARLAEKETELAAKEAELAQKEEECGLAQEAAGRLAYALAEEQNRMKRLEREMEVRLQRAVKSLALDLLRVVDNVERALAAPAGAGDGESLRRGLELIKRDFEDALARAGAVPFESRGEPFDPESHEAMGEVEGAEAAPGTVAEELARGWRLNGLLLRPARVMVAATPEPTASLEPIAPIAPLEAPDSPESPEPAHDTASPNATAPNPEPSAAASSETTSSAEPPKPSAPPESPAPAGDTASSNDTAPTATAPSPTPNAATPTPAPGGTTPNPEPSPAPSGTAAPSEATSSPATGEA